jgi:hypothetical protein
LHSGPLVVGPRPLEVNAEKMSFSVQKDPVDSTKKSSKCGLAATVW